LFGGTSSVIFGIVSFSILLFQKLKANLSIQ